MRRFVLAALAGLALAPAHAQLYKCVQGGKTVYQDAPCPAAARESTVKPPPAPPPRAATAEEAKDAEAQSAARALAEVESIAEVFAGVSICGEGEGGLNSAQAAAFEGWKERNIERISRFNASPEGPRLLQQRLQEARSVQQRGGAEAREARIALCAKVANALRPVARKPR